jgi:hypothetical protein
MSEPFQLPFGSREERIAHNESWARSLNERRAAWVGGRGELTEFRCECGDRECEERIRVTDEEWTLARAEPNRFAVAPGHVAENFEAVVTSRPRFWLVEKFGEAGEIAEKLAAS